MLHLMVQSVDVFGKRRRGSLQRRRATVSTLIVLLRLTRHLLRRTLLWRVPTRVVLRVVLQLRGRRRSLPGGLRILSRARELLGLRSGGMSLMVLVRRVVGLWEGSGAVGRR
jgi:hypothetical protein